MSPAPVYAHRKPQNGTSFGNRVFAYAVRDGEVLSSAGAKSRAWYPAKKREIAPADTWRQRLRPHSCRPRNATGFQGTPEASWQAGLEQTPS